MVGGGEFCSYLTIQRLTDKKINSGVKLSLQKQNVHHNRMVFNPKLLLFVLNFSPNKLRASKNFSRSSPRNFVTLPNSRLRVSLLCAPQVCDHKLQCQCEEGWAPPTCDSSSALTSKCRSPTPWDWSFPGWNEQGSSRGTAQHQSLPHV